MAPGWETLFGVDLASSPLEEEFARLEWVDNRRLLEPIEEVLSAEFEAMYYEWQESPAREIGLQ